MEANCISTFHIQIQSTFHLRETWHFSMKDYKIVYIRDISWFLLIMLYLPEVISQWLSSWVYLTETISQRLSLWGYLIKTISLRVSHKDYLAETISLRLSHKDYLAETFPEWAVVAVPCESVGSPLASTTDMFACRAWGRWNISWRM